MSLTVPFNYSSTGYEGFIRNILNDAGVEINGSSPGDIIVKNPEFYREFATWITLGLVKSYTKDWIEINGDAFDILFYKLFKNRDYFRLREEAHPFWKVPLAWDYLSHKYLNMNMLFKNRIVDVQYDLPPELFINFLGLTRAYTCAYWRNPDGTDMDTTNPDLLDDAQTAKLHLICKKADLKPGMILLDVGCGWGTLAKFAAENYNVRVVAFTISPEQVKIAKEYCKGLDVDVRLQSYEDNIANFKNNGPGEFDAIIALGSFEHFGYRNHQLFFDCMQKVSKESTRLVIQTISFSHPIIITDPYIERVIFPDMTCSSPAQVATASEKSHFWKLYDLHELTDNNGVSYYDPTLMAWSKNMHDNWDKIKPFIKKSGRNPEQFYKSWWPYLKICAGAYRAGTYPRIIQYTFGNIHMGNMAEIR